MSTFIFSKDSGDVTHDGKRLGRLNSAEAEVLIYLYSHKGNPISKDTLLDVGWPKKVVTPNSLNVAIKNIRECFEKINIDDIIVTHVKRGFSWNEIYNLSIIQPTKGDNESKVPLLVESSETNSFDDASTLGDISHADGNPCNDNDKEGAIDGIAINEKGNVLFSDDDSEDKSIKNTISERELRGVIADKKIIFTHIFSKVVLFFLSVTCLFLLSLYVRYWTPVECYYVHDAKFCGVGEFNESDIPNNIMSGEYVFGSLVSDGGFFYAKK